MPMSGVQISSYRMAVFPVVGALIGGAMAGPVGLYAGIKIGGLAGAVGGGVAGQCGVLADEPCHQLYRSADILSTSCLEQLTLATKLTTTAQCEHLK